MIFNYFKVSSINPVYCFLKVWEIYVLKIAKKSKYIINTGLKRNIKYLHIILCNNIYILRKWSCINKVLDAMRKTTLTQCWKKNIGLHFIGITKEHEMVNYIAGIGKKQKKLNNFMK